MQNNFTRILGSATRATVGYPSLTSLSGPGLPQDGAWAPPGRYTVLLKVGGRRYEQALQVEPDPE